MTEDAKVVARQQELLTKGYPEKVIKLAMTWAQNTADGSAKYFADGDRQKAAILFPQMLDTCLRDSERWIKAMIE